MLSERLIQFCQKEWRVMKGAPAAFFGLLMLGIALAAIAIWFILGGVISAKNATIVLQAERLAQKDDYIKELESGSARADVRDDQSLYQRGLSVASVQNPQIDAGNQTLKFAIVTASRKLDMARGFEFRDWTIVCGGDPSSSVGMGAVLMLNYYNVVCRITGNR